jgi:hypothetical protein
MNNTLKLWLQVSVAAGMTPEIMVKGKCLLYFISNDFFF